MTPLPGPPGDGESPWPSLPGPSPQSPPVGPDAIPQTPAPTIPQIDLTPYAKQADVDRTTGSLSARIDALAAMIDGAPNRGDVESARQTATAAAQAAQQATAQQSTLRERIENVVTEMHSRVDEAKQSGVLTAKETALSVTTSIVNDKLVNLGGGWGVGKIAAGALGVSGLPALAIAFAGWFIGRRVRGRIAERFDGPAVPSQPFRADAAA